jgi:hypothetical protein
VLPATEKSFAIFPLSPQRNGSLRKSAKSHATRGACKMRVSKLLAGINPQSARATRRQHGSFPSHTDEKSRMRAGPRARRGQSGPVY